MSNPLVYRNNRLFCIDEDQLVERARNSHIIGALYAAIHEEFKGASIQDRYKNLTYQQRLEKVNDFAWNWLRERRLV